MSEAHIAGVALWLCRTAQCSDAAARSICLPWLDETEQARWQGFAFARDRHIYLVGHGLLRWALSVAEPSVRPGEWRFDVDARGHPTVAGALAHRLGLNAALQFSLSHTRGMVAVAIGLGGALGVDIEALRTPGDRALNAAAMSFAPSERAWLEGRTVARRVDATLRLWTLKECYAKARGLGLHLPLESYAFELHEHRGVTRLCNRQNEDAGHLWRFLEAKPPGYRLALAYQHPAYWADAGVPLLVRAAITAPLFQTHGRAVTLRLVSPACRSGG